MDKRKEAERYKKKPPLIVSVVKLIRPQQWTKNVFVLAALVFDRSLFNTSKLLSALAGFAAFCLVSGCVYIFNDIIDRDKDRAHHEKCKRPIAAGHVSTAQAVAVFVVLLAASLLWGFWLDTVFGIILVAYLVINIAYTLKLKNLPIIDIMCLASGFVLRTVSGGALIDCTISPWLLLCTLLLALYLGIQKRRAEMKAVELGIAEGRAVLKHYNQELLRDMSSLIDSSAIMSYCLYTILSEDTSPYMIITIPFVIYGIFRYQYIASMLNLAEAPDKALLKDKPLLIDVLLWCLCCVFILYILPMLGIN